MLVHYDVHGTEEVAYFVSGKSGRGGGGSLEGRKSILFPMIYVFIKAMRSGALFFYRICFTFTKVQ